MGKGKREKGKGNHVLNEAEPQSFGSKAEPWKEA